MKVVLLLLTLFSLESYAQNVLFCGEVKRIRAWANGSATYNVWIEYKNNPVSCSGGFYLRPDTQNEDLIYSLTLSAKAANQRVCIQANPVNLNGNRCLLNYIMHE
jgi:hypothetical protein